MRYHRSMNHYTYRAEWSSEHGEYVGRCLELPWLSQWAPTMQAAIAGVERAVDEHLAERGDGEPPPLNARWTVEAAEQNVSLNQWVVQKLADRPPTGLFDP